MISVSAEGRATNAIRIFLVDDHPTFLWGLARLIIESAEPPMTVVAKAKNRSELFALLPRAAPDVIVLDADLNGDNALDWLDELSEQTAARVLVLTSNSDSSAHQGQ